MAKGIQYSFERYEKKYLLNDAQYAAVSEALQRHMKADDYGQYTVCNIYYDTDDWRLIRASIDKPLYKEKLRVRSYGVPGEDGSVFIELKKKFTRIAMLAVTSVLLLLCITVNTANFISVNSQLNEMLSVIELNQGMLPPMPRGDKPPDGDGKKPKPDG